MKAYAYCTWAGAGCLLRLNGKKLPVEETMRAYPWHGDLLDIIRKRTGISRFPDLLAEARAHLGRPQPVLPDARAKGQGPRRHADGSGGAIVCSLDAGREHARRHLPPLPESPRQHDERPALPPCAGIGMRV